MPSLFLLGALVATSDCASSSNQLPPLGEVLVIVDTDAVVPGLVGRLRVDAFDEHGTWYSSRDFGIETPAEWPASFGVYAARPNEAGTVILRLRGYADGNVRDYLGERYQPRPSGGPPSEVVPTPPAPEGKTPRLLDAHGSDITPTTEPEPLLAIDRLLRVDVPANVLQSTSVVLRGACFGTMADLATSRTCVDSENVLAEITPLPLSADTTLPTASLEGGFGGTIPCTATPRGAHNAADGTPLFDEEVCVAGGTYVFGSYPNLMPERIVTVAPFLMNKYEVSVGRFRDAVSRGLTWGSTPYANDSTLPTSTADTTYEGQEGLGTCTYSDQPTGREEDPLSCVRWRDARAFCEFEGADLPSEVQFEWVVAAAGRPYKTLYPWGGPHLDTVPCSRGDFGRSWADLRTLGQCASRFGPAPVAQADSPLGDVSVGFGVVDLGYNVSELMLDSYDELGTRCWMEQPLAASHCEDPRSSGQTSRGGSWAGSGIGANYWERSAVPAGQVGSDIGFRCVRKTTP